MAARSSAFAIAWRPGISAGSSRRSPLSSPTSRTTGSTKAAAGQTGGSGSAPCRTTSIPDGSPREISRDGGAIYRVAPDGRTTQLTPREFGIVNTLAWTTDGRLLSADTMRNEISPMTSATGRSSKSACSLRAWNAVSPDGSCLDAQDGLWNCRVAGGSCLARFRPDGSLDRLAELACSWPTGCAFGGPDFAKLYVTSARFTMTAEHIAANPQEGALFALMSGFAVGRSIASDSARVPRRARVIAPCPRPSGSHRARRTAAT